MSASAPSNQLSSWKEIADYLGVSLRTAQTWEREKGLPVQRMPGEKGRVAADPAALDRWRQSMFQARNWWSNATVLRCIALTSTLLLLGVVGFEVVGYIARHQARQPASFRLGQRSLTILDNTGQDLWRQEFPEAMEASDYSDSMLALHRKFSFTDVDHDGKLETLFVYTPLNSLRNPSALYCYSRNGEERWRFAPAQISPSNAEDYGRTHVLNDLLVTDHNSSGPQIYLLDCQLPGHFAKLFILSPRGEIQATFAHHGHMGMLESADVDGCGAKEIVMGGFAAELHEAELIAVEVPREQPNVSNQIANPAAQPPPPVKEKAVLAFPRTCVNRKLEESNRISRIVDSGNGLTVVVSELSEDPSVAVTYELDRKLQVRKVWFSDALRNLHRTLETQGILKHSLTDDEIAGFKNIIRLPPNTITERRSQSTSNASIGTRE